MNEPERLQYQKLHGRLRTHRRVLLVSHEQADGDAFGSLLAFRSILLQLGIEVVGLTPGSDPAHVDFLEGSTALVTRADEIHLETFDAVVMFDCGDVRRTHLAERLGYLGSERPFVAVIDHHPTKIEFRGRSIVDQALIERSASSTCELVYRYAVANAVTISPAMANALLTGIVTDTGGFTNGATTHESMEVAGDLLKRGANLRRIVNATVRSKTVGILQLWGRALSRLEIDQETGVVSTALTQRDFSDCGVDDSAAEGIASFLNALGEGQMAVVLRERPNGMVKGSLRTKRPDVDVAAKAAEHGGGGHRRAAGFTVAGKIVKGDRGWTIEQPS